MEYSEISLDFFNNLNLPKEKIVWLRKKYSEIIKKAREKSKSDKCVLCGKSCTSFCNSHSIPSFIIKNIATDGKIVSGINYMNNKLYNKEIGVKETLTFNIICQDCDRIYFSNYENNELYSKNVNKVVLSEIALKNYLRYFSKRIIEKEIYNELINIGYSNPSIYDMLDAAELDMKEYKNHIEKIKTRKNDYYLIDEINLDYTVPIAFQSSICLVADFEGKKVNDVFNFDSNYKTQDLHISVFPMENKTKILMFIKDGDIRYKSFYRKYRSLSLIDKLYTINYLIFRYSEEWVLNKKFIEKIDENTRNKIALSINIKKRYDNIFEMFLGLTDEDAKFRKYKINLDEEVFNFLKEKLV